MSAPLRDAATTAVQQVAAWASSVRFADIPVDVREVARRCLIDTLGVAIAGCSTGPARHAREVALELAAEGSSTLLGSSKRVTASAAAFANATAAHALDFDDNCYAGVVHGSAVIMPAALAVAEMINAGGEALLAAFVVGSEAEYAVGQAVTMRLYERGWYNTAVLGPIGATVAAAHLLKLDSDAIASALGIAIAGSGGTKACFGTDAKPLLCGRAAEAGVVAALLARAGASGPSDALEHKRGFAALFNDGIFDARPVAGLGRHWNLLAPGIDVKRIPVCLSSHTAVDALVSVMAANDLATSDIQTVNCDTTPIVIANLAYPRPRTPQEAQFSLPFAVACTLAFGDIRLEHLDENVLHEPQVLDWMTRVNITMSERWNKSLLQEAPEGAFVEVVTGDGRRFEEFCAAARGCAQHPLSDAELGAKFRACTERVMKERDAAALETRLRDIEHVSRIGRLFDDLTIPDL